MCCHELVLNIKDPSKSPALEHKHQWRTYFLIYVCSIMRKDDFYSSNSNSEQSLPVLYGKAFHITLRTSI